MRKSYRNKEKDSIMNIWQAICLSLGIIVLTGLWVYHTMISHTFDLAYLIVVSIMTIALTAGFIFACKNIGRK
jgi:hypothetical protein